MISKERFIKMMTLAEQFLEEEDRWTHFGIEVYEMPITDIPWEMFNCWARGYFDVEGRDWINWYLWERKGINNNEVLPCYNEDGSEFYVNTPADLWDLVESHRLTPCIDSPCILVKKSV